MKLHEIMESEFITDHDEIRAWLDEMEIKNYAVQEDGVIDVNDYVNLYYCGLHKIPVQFGKVTGSFDIYSNHLASLKGSPYYVGGDFRCQNNLLTSLKYCPKTIGDGIYANNNDITSLEGISEMIERCEMINLDQNSIDSHLLGLVMIKDLNRCYLSEISKDVADAYDIIKKYLCKPELIYDCQSELYDKGLERFAQL